MNILFLTSAAPKKGPIPITEKRPPLGVGYLMGVLKKDGHNIYFSDEYLKPSNILDSCFLRDFKIDFVGIYSNTICYAATLEMFKKLEKKRELKEWNGKIMVGGPHTAFGYKEIPDYVDYVVIGEGEIVVPKILNGEIKDRIVRGEKVKDLDTLPFPAWEEFIHLPYMWHDYRMGGTPIYTFNTSRGCPYSCTFCSVKGVWGKDYRYMSAERVISDIEYMRKFYGLKGVFFREDHFTLNKKRTVQFCESLIKKNLNIHWMCESRVDSIDDPEVVKLMAQAGCKALYIGVESGSPRMLELFKKGETVEQFIRVFDYLKQYKINSHASFVMHAPGETDEDRSLTDKFIERIKPDTIRKNVFIGLPGSELTETARKEGLIEFTDSNGIAYLKGYHENVEKYYDGYEYYKVYDPVTHDDNSSYQYFKQSRNIDNILDRNPVVSESNIRARFNMEPVNALLDAFLEEIVLHVWENNKASKGSIAIYGAGTHTQIILAIVRKLGFDLPGVIFDMKPEEALISDVKVECINNLSNYKLKKLLISNDRKHYEIYSDLLNNKSLKDIEIIDPYLYLPHAPFRK